MRAKRTIMVELPDESGLVPMNIRIGKELKARVKAHCGASGITMQDFLIDALENALEKARQKIRPE